MSELTWYYSRGGQVYGPTTLDRLRQMAAAGDLVADDPVCRAGDAAWQRASDVQDLLSLPGTARPASDRPTIPVPRDKLSSRLLRGVLGERLWAVYVRAYQIVIGIVAVATLVIILVTGGRAAIALWRSEDGPPVHLPVRVEVCSVSQTGTALVVRNTSPDRVLSGLRVIVTSTGGRTVDVRPGGGRAIHPGQAVDVQTFELGGLTPGVGDLVRVSSNSADDPPLVFTVSSTVAK